MLLAKPGCKVLRELTFSANNANLRPDLVVIRWEQCFIVDVTVGFEDTGSLEKAETKKREKYSVLLHEVQTMFGMRRAKVVPIVIGARGPVPRSTKNSLRDLGLDRQALFWWLLVETLKCRKYHT
ncbi:hypothetical protein J437_LFUL018664 [Ladona fulva]|uniref:Reverse transcriptase n=1 Tax=Ladona fulva TaxID=123851 RepID=A0A8K0KPT9_LADFU|nr:hypothetical protein J437_LFUL018664 [Ladona fulva]